MKNGIPRPWLPEAAIDAGLDRTVAAIAGDWSAHWLPAGALRSLARNLVASDADMAWLAAGGSVAVGLTTAARRTLGLALLAAPADATIAGAADRRMIDAVVDAALADLVARLAAAAQETARPAAARQRPALDDTRQRPLGFDHQPLVTILIGQGAAVTMARPTRAPSPRPPLPTLSTALAPQCVSIGARVGGCTLTLAELAALAPGDVVLLDRAVTETADLTLAHAFRSLARCRIEPGDDHLSLVLIDAIARQDRP